MIGVVGLALVAAACGGDDDDDASDTTTNASVSAAAPAPSATGSTADQSQGSAEPSSNAPDGSVAAPTGDPIITMTIASVNYNGPTYENGLITAKAYEQFINSHGGINGRPLQALTCDEQGVATGSTACAREAVDKGAIAVVGVPDVLRWSRRGGHQPGEHLVLRHVLLVRPERVQRSNGFRVQLDPISSGASILIKAAEDGCTNMVSLSIDIPTADDSFAGAKAILESTGYDGELKLVKLPPTSQDYSAEVALATEDNPDCLLMIVPENQVAALLPAFFNTGSEARLYGSQGNFNPVSVKGFEDRPQVKEATIFGLYADLKSDAYADFRQALDEFDGDTKDYDYNSLAGLGTWTAFEGFKQVVESMDGPMIRGVVHRGGRQDGHRQRRTDGFDRPEQAADRGRRAIRPADLQPHVPVQPSRWVVGRHRRHAADHGEAVAIDRSRDRMRRVT